MIDVDHFKAYNDFYGHQAGDDCLRMIAQVLRASATRQGDMAARYGGEEFVLLLPGADIAGARVMAEALRSGLRRLRVAHTTSPTASIVTVSVGVAVGVPEAENGAAALISAADKALYQAKRAGRDRVVCAV
jgi:diguanylate cyclase (GGDEF)-like protein